MTHEPVPLSCKTTWGMSLLNKARRTNAKRDEIDGGATHWIRVSAALRTCLAALQCALDAKDWAVVAEVACMLVDAELRARKEEEILVLSQILRTLNALDEPAKGPVVRYLAARYEDKP